MAVAALPAPRFLGVRVKGSVHAAPVPLTPVPSPSSRCPMRTPGTFQRLGSASWGSFGGSIQSTARSGSGSGSSSSLSSVLLQQPSRLSVVTAAQRRGEKAHLLFGDSSTQVRAPVLGAVYGCSALHLLYSNSSMQVQGPGCTPAWLPSVASAVWRQQRAGPACMRMSLAAHCCSCCPATAACRCGPLNMRQHSSLLHPWSIDSGMQV